MVLEKSRKVLQSKRKHLKKQGKRNRETQRIRNFNKRRVQSIVRKEFVRYVIMFATDGTERDPDTVYRLFAKKRPEKMNLDDATWS